MGEIADSMMTGKICEWCGFLFRDKKTPGHPRHCKRCIDGCGGNEAYQEWLQETMHELYLILMTYQKKQKRRIKNG